MEIFEGCPALGRRRLSPPQAWSQLPRPATSTRCLIAVVTAMPVTAPAAVSDLEVRADHGRQSIGGGMKLILSRPVYPEIGEGCNPGLGVPGGVAVELAIAAPG